MSLHCVTSVVNGLPNVEATHRYYSEFGLTADEDGWFLPPTSGCNIGSSKL
jgi:hypothetical protein